MDWRQVMTPEILSLVIPIAAILVGGAIAITSMLIKHRERIAMIEHGMNPDAPGERNGRGDSP
jgi:hypothetical protein